MNNNEVEELTSARTKFKNEIRGVQPDSPKPVVKEKINPPYIFGTEFLTPLGN